MSEPEEECYFSNPTEIFMAGPEEECYFIDSKLTRERLDVTHRLVFAMLGNVPLKLYAPIAYTPLMPRSDDMLKVFRWFVQTALCAEDRVLKNRTGSCLLLGFTLNMTNGKELVGCGVQHFYVRENKVCIMRTDRSDAVLARI